MMSQSTGGATRQALDPLDERGLLDYVTVLWRRKLWIVAAVVVAAAAALALRRNVPPVYEAATTIAIGPTRAGDMPDVASTLVSFRALLDNVAMARAVIDELDLGKPPDSLTPLSLLDRVSVTDIRGTAYLSLRFRLGDARLAAAAANSIAKHAIELRESTARKADVAARDAMKQALDDAKGDLDRSAEKLAEYKSSAGVEISESDARFLVDQRGRLQDVVLEIGIERGRLESAQEQLARASTSDRRGLEEQVSSLRTRLAALERERDELTRLTGKEATARLRQWYQKQTEVERLEAEFNAAQAAYADAWKAFVQARSRVGLRTPQLSVVDPAQPPSAPLVQKRFGVVVAMLAALVLASAAAIVYEWLPR